ncbi:MAG: hypothetical protein A2521_07290 [Deltaproteobacteria bacterium RIFOXYD12_FULL_57_12]|nr:MAG: hypothetical protein A2521_07290 [Deltaproteobacteria bacterium RIFOXYD12_FULL_57_12]
MKKTLIPTAEHQRVIASVTDVPEERPAFPIPLNEVGISGKTVWIDMDIDQPARLPFTAAIMVNLTGERRGIHMSRIEQVISELHFRKFARVTDYGQTLCRLVLDSQPATTASVELTGSLPLLRQTAISGRLSVDTVRLSCSVSMQRAGDRLHSQATTAVGLNHLTACPCTQVYNQCLYETMNTSSPPLATHSQRSFTTLAVTTEDDAPAPSPDELIDCLSSALHIAQDLLKRPDEAELVLAAHLRPQFAEDAVRDTARAVAERLGQKLLPTSGIVVESLSLESIHIHDVRCRLATTLADIRNCLS